MFFLPWGGQVLCKFWFCRGGGLDHPPFRPRGRTKKVREDENFGVHFWPVFKKKCVKMHFFFNFSRPKSLFWYKAPDIFFAGWLTPPIQREGAQTPPLPAHSIPWWGKTGDAGGVCTCSSILPRTKYQGNFVHFSAFLPILPKLPRTFLPLVVLTVGHSTDPSFLQRLCLRKCFVALWLKPLLHWVLGTPT